jgi:manganese-transporting P-type ATPase
MMLMIFEGVMCKQRQNSVLMMRNMRRPAYPLLVYRNSQWDVMTTDGIFPGDIISLSSDTSIVIDQQGQARAQPKQPEEEGKIIPGDIVLITGSCVVNEAMLTGESIPKMKEAIDLSYAEMLDTTTTNNNNNNRTNIFKQSAWNRHILLGGTQLQQHSLSPEIIMTGKPTSFIPLPPDRGCVGIVIRTGFATTQVRIEYE